MWRLRWLVTGLLALATLSAGVIVMQQSMTRVDAAQRKEEFQSLVQGLGFGAAVDLAECEFGFDPRLRPACSQQEGAVPGGFFLCSRHAGCVTSAPSLAPAGMSEADVYDHASR
jgi:hypothetical protein